MKKKKTTFPKVEIVWENDFIKICKDDQDYFFEIGKEITSDIGEGISILMRQTSIWKNKDLWETPIENKIKTDEITPEKSLYWLSGGDKEWMGLDNYAKPWRETALIFQEEYGLLVIMIISKAKTFGDIRDGFLKYLSLPILYDFAVKNDMVC